jgi:hypothetical protein
MLGRTDKRNGNSGKFYKILIRQTGEKFFSSSTFHAFEAGNFLTLGHTKTPTHMMTEFRCEVILTSLVEKPEGEGILNKFHCT